MNVMLIILGMVAYVIIGHFVGLLLLAHMENWQSFKKIWPKTKIGRLIWIETLSLGWIIMVLFLLVLTILMTVSHFCYNMLIVEIKRFLKYGTTITSDEHEF